MDASPPKQSLKERVAYGWQYVARLAVTAVRSARALAGGESVLVLGDSHAWVFYHWLFDVNFPRRVFHICMVAGATASGLENPNSKTGAMQKFEEAIRKYPSKVFILQLGEVDAGFVIWYRAQKYLASVESMLEQTVERYAAFIRRMRALGRVIVVGAPLPTIPDEQPCGQVANLRKEIDVSQRQRTELTLQFNTRVEQACAAEGADFIGLDADSLDANRRVKKELLNRDPCDHHYRAAFYARLLVEKLKRVL
jgi:hypothetical protein